MNNIALYRRASFIGSITGTVGPAVEMVFAYNKGGGAVAVAALPFLRLLSSLVAPVLAPSIARFIPRKNAVLLQYGIAIVTSLLSAVLTLLDRLDLPLLYLMATASSFAAGSLSPIASAYMRDLVERDYADVPTAGRASFTLGKAIAFALVILLPIGIPGFSISDGKEFLAATNLLNVAGSLISLALLARTVPVRHDSEVKAARLASMAQTIASIRAMFGTKRLVCFWTLVLAWNTCSVMIMYRPGFLTEQFKTGPAEYLQYVFVTVIAEAIFFQHFAKRTTAERNRLGSLRFLSSLVTLQFVSLLISIAAPNFFMAAYTSAICNTLWDLVFLAIQIAVQQLGGDERQEEYFALNSFVQKLAAILALGLSVGANWIGCTAMMVINGIIGLVIAVCIQLIWVKEP